MHETCLLNLSKILYINYYIILLLLVKIHYLCRFHLNLRFHFNSNRIVSHNSTPYLRLFHINRKANNLKAWFYTNAHKICAIPSSDLFCIFLLAILPAASFDLMSFKQTKILLDFLQQLLDRNNRIRLIVRLMQTFYDTPHMRSYRKNNLFVQ